MKKFLLSLLCCLFCLSGCDSNVPTTSNSLGTFLPFTSKWGNEYANTIVGNLSVDIPYMEADRFIVDTFVDDFNDIGVVIYLIYEDESLLDVKIEDYAEICRDDAYEVSFQTQRQYLEDGTYIEYDIYFADKEINETTGIELQFLLGAYERKDCIGIFAFNYDIVDPTCWPSNLVNKLLGHDVPHLPSNPDYEYDATIASDSGGEYVAISVQYALQDAEESYKSLLESEGFTLDDSEYDEYGYFAYSPDNKYVIQFKYVVDYDFYGIIIYIFEIA